MEKGFGSYIKQREEIRKLTIGPGDFYVTDICWIMNTSKDIVV